MTSYLATFALPYANGPLHLGHLVEMCDADIWVRARKMMGNTVVFVSGNDAHGTPIMLKAAQMGIEPQQLVDSIHQDHCQVLSLYHIALDNFSRTDNSNHRLWVERIFNKLKTANLIEKTERIQAFDEQEQMFLPDRYVKGICPDCEAPEQYGDNCERCGATYSPTDLKEPYSVVSDKPVTFKPSPQLELSLVKQQEFIKQHVPSYTPKPLVGKFSEWLDKPLKPWSISRYTPYHGLPVPGERDQHFYVWFDAPIGYLSFFDEALVQQGLSVESLLQKNSEWKLVHFIGKDIAYFHGLFWPVLLEAADLKLPEHLYVHGFLTVDGQKMSKSKGTLINAQKFAQICNPELFRYFVATKFNAQIDDINFQIDEFIEKINSDIIGKFLNILSRLSKLLFTYTQGKFHQLGGETPLLSRIRQQRETVFSYYEKRKYQDVIKIVMSYCDLLNENIAQLAPWKSFKDPEAFEQTHQRVTEILTAFFVLSEYLSPVTPILSEKIAEYYGPEGLRESYQPLMNRLEKNNFKELITMEQPVENNEASIAEETVTEEATIGIEDFLKVDLRIAKIIEAKSVEGADKLVQVTLDIGEKQLNVFAGIKKFYTPEQLLGKKVVACVNLKPRKMKFGVSEAMMLAASGDEDLSMLILDKDLEAGAKIS